VIRKLCALGVALLLAACGGGGGGGSASSSGTTTTPPPPPPAATLTNFTTLTVDGGPAILDTGPNAFTDNNTAFVSVTLCAPGSTTNCQTIDHVLVDTGSTGLRVFASVLTPGLLAALPNETDPNNNPVGECYSFVDGFIFGSVRTANFQIGGESVNNMPLQVIADSGVFSSPPKSCTAGGGTSENTVQTFGANGIIGIGAMQTDCDTFCEVAGGSGAAIYYDCPSGGCSTIIARNASTTAPFQQVPNPVAAMAVDNNGTIVSLAAAPSGGAATGTGTLFFGIGTETNNALGSATVMTTNSEAFLTAIYKNQTLANSFIDSGSSAFFFIDSTITLCTSADFTGFYCPASPLNLTPTLEGQNGASKSAAFTLNNAQTILSTANAVAPGLGANPDDISTFQPIPSSFDFGLPFFYGRPIFTAIEGRNAGGTTGPYFAY
jgi:hypothetical protein